jgi:hypothetical protein
LVRFEKGPEVSHTSDLFTVEFVTRYAGAGRRLRRPGRHRPEQAPGHRGGAHEPPGAVAAMRTHHEIYEKMSATLVKALNVDEDELH